VPLWEELAALRRFERLHALRFGRALEVRIDVPPAVAARCHVPPVTLQELLENAVKHNVVAADAPLIVHAVVNSDELIVANTVRPRRDAPHSTGVGLANLAGRYRLLTTREVRWERTADQFRVIVPLLSNDEEQREDEEADALAMPDHRRVRALGSG
jgi:LytS/YehU family sensor histidine kinase